MRQRGASPGQARPQAGQRRIDFVTRLRRDARLYRLPPTPGLRGPVWGKQLAATAGRPLGGRRGGRARCSCTAALRAVRYKEVLCLWRVLGHDVVVKAVVAFVEGYKKRFTVVSSATDLSGLQIVELFCAASGRRTASGISSRGWAGRNAGPGHATQSSGRRRRCS